MMDQPQPNAPHAAQMADHWWWRPGWRTGRRFLTWHVTFDGQDELHRLVDGYQTRLQRLAGLDLVPRRWLHLTMQGVGFSDETDPSEVSQIVAAVGRHCARLTQFPLTIGPPLVTAEAITMPASPPEPIRRLRAAVRAGIADVWGADRVPEGAGGFAPHVSLAYSNDVGSAAPYIAALGQEEPMTAQATVTRADLISLGRDDCLYQWTTVSAVVLRDRDESQGPGDGY